MNTEQPAQGRKEGVKLVWEGAILYAIGFVGLWLSFRFTGNAKAILGAGPLIGSWMIGYGGTHFVLDERLKPLRWVVGIIAALAGLGVAILILESTLGVVFA